MLKDVDERLWRWADCVRESRDFGLGYPKRSTIHKAMREGAGAGHRGAPVGVSLPEEVEETDAAVAAMPVKLRRAVWSKYMRRRVDKHSAHMLRIPIGTFRLRIDQAHYWIAGRISDAA